MAFSPGGPWLASASIEGTIRLWDLKTGELQQTLEDKSNDAGDPNNSRWSASLLRSLHPTEEIALETPGGHIAHPSGLTFSPNGQGIVFIPDFAGI